MTDPTSPIQRALAKFDNSPTKLAAAIGRGVLRQHVEHWLKPGRSVPEKHVRALHELTGVPCWEFCPDDWYSIWPDLIGAPGAPAVPEQPQQPQQQEA